MAHRKRIGLALGGGLVRGLAHIGVLSVLAEEGIPVDFVAGTSAGSIVGAAFSAGWEIDRIRRYAGRLQWWHIARPIWPVRGFVSFDRLAKSLAKEMGDPDFSDLPLPYVVIATDLERGAPVRIRQGKVALAVQASCSVPGLAAPVEWNGRLLCDGGASDMVPVDALHQMGAEYVIGVDIFAFDIRRALGPFGYFIAGIEILLERSGGGIDEADCLITPNLHGKTYLNFSRRQELYELGRRAAWEKLDRIRLAVFS